MIRYAHILRSDATRPYPCQGAKMLPDRLTSGRSSDATTGSPLRSSFLCVFPCYLGELRTTQRNEERRDSSFSRLVPFIRIGSAIPGAWPSAVATNGKDGAGGLQGSRHAPCAVRKAAATLAIPRRTAHGACLLLFLRELRIRRDPSPAGPLSTFRTAAFFLFWKSVLGLGRHSCSSS